MVIIFIIILFNVMGQMNISVKNIVKFMYWHFPVMILKA